MHIICYTGPGLITSIISTCWLSETAKFYPDRVDFSRESLRLVTDEIKEKWKHSKLWMSEMHSAITASCIAANIILKIIRKDAW
jgi:hypothetical protein